MAQTFIALVHGTASEGLDVLSDGCAQRWMCMLGLLFSMYSRFSISALKRGCRKRVESLMAERLELRLSDMKCTVMIWRS